MPTINTGDLTIPKQYFDPFVKNLHEGSVISQLSGATPMKFGPGEAFIIDAGEAEYVGEGQNKSSSAITSRTQTFEPYKFHKTVRLTNEFEWANQDHQLGVLEQILAKIQPALTRALDFGVLHGINPMTGDAVTAMANNNLGKVSQTVTPADGAEPYEILDAADIPLLTAGYTPSGIAADPKFLVPFRSARTKDGVKLYPNLGFDGVSDLEGHRTAVSRTVAARGVMGEAGSGVSAFVGDFSAITWGIQKQIGLERIEYGDPDGGGDLKRNNQVAFRAEIVYGWGIQDMEAFAKIAEPAAGE